MFNPADYITVAEELSLGDESKLRTAICRAYFYAFLSAREWLKTKGVIFSNKGTDHGLVQQSLQTHVNRATKDLLSDLRRNYRNEADYNLAKTIQQQEAKDAIVLAKQIVGNINTVNAPSASTPQGTSPQTP